MLGVRISPLRGFIQIAAFSWGSASRHPEQRSPQKQDQKGQRHRQHDGQPDDGDGRKFGEPCSRLRRRHRHIAPRPVQLLVPQAFEVADPLPGFGFGEVGVDLEGVAVISLSPDGPV